jgi:hypothetical protein
MPNVFNGYSSSDELSRRLSTSTIISEEAQIFGSGPSVQPQPPVGQNVGWRDWVDPNLPWEGFIPFVNEGFDTPTIPPYKQISSNGSGPGPGLGANGSGSIGFQSPAMMAFPALAWGLQAAGWTPPAIANVFNSFWNFGAGAWSGMPSSISSGLVAAGALIGQEIDVSTPNEWTALDWFIPDWIDLTPWDGWLPWAGDEKPKPGTIMRIGKETYTVVKFWQAPRETGTWFVKFNNGTGAARDKDGVWKHFRWPKPIVIYPDGTKSLKTFTKADNALDREAKKIAKALSNRGYQVRRKVNPKD